MMKQRTWMWIKIACLAGALLLGQRLTFGQEASGAGVAGQADESTANYQTLLPLVTRQYFNGSTGVLDPSFGGTGIVSIIDGGASAAILQPDGKLVLAGSSPVTDEDYQTLVVRLNPDGSLDTSFDGDGLVATNLSSYGEGASGVALQADGKIVVAGGGDITGSGYSDMLLLRYNPDGSLDTSFDEDGWLTTDFAGDGDGAQGVTIQPDGKIVVTGVAVMSENNVDIALVRYNTDGSLDTSFGIGGKVNSDYGTGKTEWGTAVTLQEDGKLVVAAFTTLPELPIDDIDIALLRYNSDGSLDSGFGVNGWALTDFYGENEYIFEALLQPDGKIVAAGWVSYYNGTGYETQFALVRYTPSGSLDDTFGTGGKVATNLTYNDYGLAAALQPDGKILVGGYTETTDQPGGEILFALARFYPNGTLDTSFGTGGYVITDVSAGDDYVSDMVLQPDGKVVLAGSGNDVMTVVRYK